jgi:hypothetical protein
MRASLLLYRKLQKELEEYGFIVNPYDPCVANKSVGGGAQLTVIWHLDDLMTSCKIDFELTKLSCYQARIYGPKLTMHTGRKHDYLGIDLEFREDGNLDVSMVKYLKGALEEFPEQIVGKSATPAGDRLFDIRDEKDRKLLEEERAVAFHHTADHGTTFVHGDKGAKGHTNGGSLPENESEITRRGGLGKTKAGIEISEQYQILKAQHKRE